MLGRKKDDELAKAKARIAELEQVIARYEKQAEDTQKMISEYERQFQELKKSFADQISQVAAVIKEKKGES